MSATPIATKGDAEQALAGLNEIMDRLIATIEEETTRARAGRIAAVAELSATKVELARLYSVESERVKSALARMLPDAIESLRKHKLEHWDRNRESNRAWLALNMMTEANAGFRAFHYGDKKNREVDFVLLRQRLAQGGRWSEELIQEIAPWTQQRVPQGVGK